MPDPAAPFPAALLQTFRMVAEKLTVAQDPWWLIGGAAARLQGARTVAISDIDVIMSVRDARRILADLGIPPKADGGTDRFRSDVFARWTSPPVPVDLMGGFQVLARDGWQPVRPATREPVPVADKILYVPSRLELIGICRLFGRPKDLARAEALSEAGHRTASRP